MTMQAKTSPSPLMWISAIAIVLFSGIGVAAFMGWLPSSYGNQDTDIEAAQAAPAMPAHKAYSSLPNSNQSAANNAICAECGVVDSVRTINDAKDTTGIGIVGGAVIGGLLGNQVGGGRGKDAATVAGAVGGAVAGNEVEKRAGSTQHYEITVRFEDGSSRVFHESSPPAWQSGDHVKVIDGTLRSNG